ncbi:hypothetical protein [Micromonospora zhanjiangensis]|uniref:Uncharacterized protein n=1 Tax=Micromonospora zhanjiangensis TaxID=1522057 RepID=A0ABV8KP72_9ACTN
MTNYPVPHHPGDTRLSAALLGDLRTTLLKHGYPELSHVDRVNLELVLGRFLYRRPSPFHDDVRPASEVTDAGGITDAFEITDVDGSADVGRLPDQGWELPRRAPGWPL